MGNTESSTYAQATYTSTVVSTYTPSASYFTYTPSTSVVVESSTSVTTPIAPSSTVLDTVSTTPSTSVVFSTSTPPTSTQISTSLLTTTPATATYSAVTTSATGHANCNTYKLTYPAACCPNTLVPMQKVASTAKRTQSTSWPLNWMRFANHDITSGGDPVANYTGLATETDCMQMLCGHDLHTDDSVGWDGATGVDVPYKSAAFLYSGGCSDAAVQAMADSAPPGSKFTPDQIQDLQNDCANVGSDLSAPVPASSGPSYTRTPYFNAAGGDITSFTGLPDEAACHDACTSSPDCIGVIWQLYNTDEPSSLCYLKSSVGVLNNGTDGAQPFCVFAGKDDEEYFTAVSSIDASTQTDTASTPLSTSTQTVYSEAPTPPASLTTSTVYVEAPTPTSTNVVSGSTPIASSVSVSYVQAATPGTTTTSTAYAQSTACAVNNVAPVTTCPSGLLLVTANVATLAKLTTVKLLGGGRPVTVDCGSAGTYTY